MCGHNQKFKNQIIGQKQSDLFTSNGEYKVDTVSGATYTSSATLNGIDIALTLFQ